MSEHPRLAEQLCYSIYSASLAIKRLYKPLLDEMGVTYPQYLVLNVLWEQGELMISQIAETLALETSTLTPLLKRLENEGFVCRKRSREDERKVLITLTEKGQRLEETSLCLSETLLCRSGLEGDAVQQLNEKIIQLRNSIVDQEGSGN
jgi:DNA-binding MarR family transcriptional regulator